MRVIRLYEIRTQIYTHKMRKAIIYDFFVLKEKAIKKKTSEPIDQRTFGFCAGLRLTGRIFRVCAGEGGPALSIDPDFLQLVQENPEDTFKVIVVRDTKTKKPKDMELEDLVQQGGGKVKKQLGIIESFSAEMSGKEVEKLAKNPKVRLITPDYPVISSGTGGLSTVLDKFEHENYAGNNGTENWDFGWQEVGDFGTSAQEDGSIRLK